ncbi:hypothetical protein D0894_02140 [Pseudomonas monteilii]|uniref:Uncharacterized protein n=1 Tax=Pseudomonas monteilii TaxID=76759 RepID=A0A399MF39_9PSED|nr:hypothetical protein D0894_02140 [Pseudomonas monteilii]
MTSWPISKPDFACTGLFAGKPAPTGIAHALNVRSPCGSGLAREEAGTSNLALKPPRRWPSPLPMA